MEDQAWLYNRRCNRPQIECIDTYYTIEEVRIGLAALRVIVSNTKQDLPNRSVKKMAQREAERLTWGERTGVEEISKILRIALKCALQIDQEWSDNDQWASTLDKYGIHPTQRRFSTAIWASFRFLEEMQKAGYSEKEFSMAFRVNRGQGPLHSVATELITANGLISNKSWDPTKPRPE